MLENPERQCKEDFLLYIYIYIIYLKSFRCNISYFSGHFSVWMERELIRCPTHQLLRGLECASCSPRHPFKVNSSCLVHATDSCGKRHCNFFAGCWTLWQTICRLSNPSDVTSQHFDSTWRRTGWNYRSYAIMRRLGILEYQSRFVARFPNRLKLGVGTLETFLGVVSWIENHRPTFVYRPIAIFETRRSSLLGARMKWKLNIKFAWENLVSWTDSMYNCITV